MTDWLMLESWPRSAELIGSWTSICRWTKARIMPKPSTKLQNGEGRLDYFFIEEGNGTVVACASVFVRKNRDGNSFVVFIMVMLRCCCNVDIHGADVRRLMEDRGSISNSRLSATFIVEEMETEPHTHNIHRHYGYALRFTSLGFYPPPLWPHALTYANLAEATHL